MGLTGVLVAALLTLPRLPAALDVPCGADQYTGVTSPERPNITLKHSEFSSPGAVTFRFAVGGYMPPVQLDELGTLLAVRLDSETPLYTDLRSSDPYGFGTFDLGFASLTPGKHMLAVALIKGKTDESTSYAKVCFTVK